MPSLLDAVDLRQLRPLARSGAGAIAACLVDAGAVQLDAADPDWPDRDRIVAVEGAPADALRARLRAHGLATAVLTAPLGGEALGLAYGAAVVSARTGGVWRAWCVLDDDACDDGAVWEAARAAAQGQPAPLTVLVGGGSCAPLWEACGWPCTVAPRDNPAQVLAALDRAVVTPSPAAVLVT